MKRESNKMLQSNMKVAIVHDNLMQYGGAERVLETWCYLYPKADIYTIAYHSPLFNHSVISKHKIYTSFVNNIPFKQKFYKFLFPLYPAAFNGFNFYKYDLVISSSYTMAHSVITHPRTKHICYMHTPSRWLWSSYHDYVNTTQAFSSKIIRFIMRITFHFLRPYDFIAAQRPNIMIANSKEVQKRIKKYYHRTSQIIHPPVDLISATFNKKNKIVLKKQDLEYKEKIFVKDYYLLICRLVPYKRVDLLIKTFKKLPKQRLLIAGDGPQFKKLSHLSKKNSNITLLGTVSELYKIELLKNARAFVYPAYDDFGIVLVEAQMAGIPVIAYYKGGASEIIVNHKTGVLYPKQTVKSMLKAIKLFTMYEKNNVFSSKEISKHASVFSTQKFITQWTNL